MYFIENTELMGRIRSTYALLTYNQGDVFMINQVHVLAIPKYTIKKPNFMSDMRKKCNLFRILCKFFDAIIINFVGLHLSYN